MNFFYILLETKLFAPEYETSRWKFAAHIGSPTILLEIACLVDFFSFRRSWLPRTFWAAGKGLLQGWQIMKWVFSIIWEEYYLRIDQRHYRRYKIRFFHPEFFDLAISQSLCCIIGMASSSTVFRSQSGTDNKKQGFSEIFIISRVPLFVTPTEMTKGTFRELTFSSIFKKWSFLIPMKIKVLYYS